MSLAMQQNKNDRPDNRALAPYATHWQNSRGRIYDEPSAHERTPFQRDRDRIIHSDAFRRLQYKTQVIINIEQGDFRTRLTHTLEVAQLTRSICRAMSLDEDLGEAVALAHDLGHPPFGHAGEDALNRCMKDFGGFYHNDQTLHILRDLECRYGAFDGLNLTWEALEGIAKHNGPVEGPYDDLIADLEPNTWCGLEAQAAALADDIAYNHHDLDDGLSTNNLHLDEVIASLPQFSRVWEEVTATFPKADQRRQVKETISRMIGRQVKDVLSNSELLLARHNPQSAEEVRALAMPVVAFSDEVQEENKQVKAFLMDKLYRHYKVNRMVFKAQRVLEDLFEAFMNHRRTLPDEIQAKLPKEKEDMTARAVVVCNYISSLTDRAAFMEHSRLYGSAMQLTS